MDPSAEAMQIEGASDLSLNGLPEGKVNVSDLIKTPQNARLYQATQELKSRIHDLLAYELENPKPAELNTREEKDNEKKVLRTIESKERQVRCQLAIVKTLYRQSVLKVREEKAKTADDRAVDDALILGLHNLKYEEQSLRSEIAAAENYDHKYTKLPLISAEEFIQEFPEHANASEHELMVARIEHEHQVRVKLEERRTEKLKQKQKLIAEVKKGKDKLTNLDGMLQEFVDSGDPIMKVLGEPW